MNQKRVFGVVLRFDARGWRDAPPVLGALPSKEHRDRSGELREVVYDWLPAAGALTLEEACRGTEARLRDCAVTTERTVLGRCALHFAIAFNDEYASCRYTWPASFLELVDRTGVKLTATHYLSDEAEASPA
jgi:hypothetical protein